MRDRLASFDFSVREEFKHCPSSQHRNVVVIVGSRFRVGTNEKAQEGVVLQLGCDGLDQISSGRGIEIRNQISAIPRNGKEMSALACRRVNGKAEELAGLLPTVQTKEIEH